MRPRAASRLRNCSSGGGAVVLVYRRRLPVRDRRRQTRRRFRRLCHLPQLDLCATQDDAQRLHAYPARRAASAANGNVKTPAPNLLAGTCTIASSTGTISQASTQIAAVAPGLFRINPNGLAAANLLDVSASVTQTPENDYTLQGGQFVATPCRFAPPALPVCRSPSAPSKPPLPTPGPRKSSSASTR